MTVVTASAPTKVILFGEHLVVHDGYALLASIDRRVTAVASSGGKIIAISSEIGKVSRPISTDSRNNSFKGSQELVPLLEAAEDIAREYDKSKTGLDIKISSEVRPGIGLGSSAAACVATVAAVGSLYLSLDRAWICERAINAEQLIHGTSSGADCYASTYGGVVSYSKTKGMKRIQNALSLPLLICDTGVMHSTKDQIAIVERFKRNDQKLFEQLLHEGTEIYQESIEALAFQDLNKLGSLMNRNQIILRRIGVSHPRTEEIIKTSLRAGALGAKITGAGGGGAVIVLADTVNNAMKIKTALQEQGYSSMYSQVDSTGVSIESPSEA